MLFETASIYWQAGAAGAAVAFLTCVLVVLTKSWHGRLTLDGSSGVQKFHTAPTPRVGGLGIYLGVLACIGFLGGAAGQILAMVAIAGIPAFLAGFIEDLTKRVSPAKRLVATLISGLIFAVVYGASAELIDTQWISKIIEPNWVIYLGGVVLVAVGMAGVANAVNIIDGFHGLASGSLVIMHLAFATLALSVGDADLAAVALCLAAVSGGFMLINFPLGKIFLGDAGAYFGGFALAAIAVLLTARNSEISPFISLLVIFYPVYETLFSIRRKLRREGHSPSQPDGVHMHMLVSRSFARPISRAIGMPASRNALAGVAMWPFPLVCGLLALAFAESGRAAVVGCLVFALLYGRIYLIISLQKQPFLNRAEAYLAARRHARETL
jgi:UDP-N-acetylmuramyl pentapeptide phosphotransferase/UDP-N-acetylglucosamine-1-phosphate transferase